MTSLNNDVEDSASHPKTVLFANDDGSASTYQGKNSLKDRFLADHESSSKSEVADVNKNIPEVENLINDEKCMKVPGKSPILNLVDVGEDEVAETIFPKKTALKTTVEDAERGETKHPKKSTSKRSSGSSDGNQGDKLIRWKRTSVLKKTRRGFDSSANSHLSLEKEVVIETMSMLLFRIEAERQKQRLAHLYYSKWHFWTLFIPAALLTLLSSILAFLGQTDRWDCTPTGNSFAIIVGCLAGVSTFLQALANHLAYGTSADMHKAAAIDLQEISDALKFDVMQTSLVDDSNMQVNIVVRYRELYEQVMKGTKSIVPLEISQAFDLIDARLDSIVELAEKYDIDPNSTQINDFMIDCVTNLYCEIVSYNEHDYTDEENKKCWKFWQVALFPWQIWPWGLPDPVTVVKKSLRNVCQHEKTNQRVLEYLKVMLLDGEKEEEWYIGDFYRENSQDIENNNEGEQDTDIFVPTPREL